MMTDGIPHQVQPFYGVPLSTLAAFFDSVYVSFYKGLGAMAGAMLLGDEATVAAARVWQKRRGGDVFTRGPLALSCEMAFRAAVLRQPLPHRPPSSRLSLFGGAVLSHFGGASAGALPLSFEARYARLRHCVALVQRLAGEYATRHSFRHSSDALPNTAPQPLLFFDPPAPNTAPQPLLFFDPPAPQSCLVHGYLRGDPAHLERCHERARAVTGVRLWNALRGRGHMALAPMVQGDGRITEVGVMAGVACTWSYFEWSMGPFNARVPDAVLEAGWRAFFEVLTE
jgi:hypothetical protein